MISIALTKGRLEKETLQILDKIGCGLEEFNNKGRKLVFNDTRKDIKYFLVKAADSITYVENGVADIGVVGKDTLLESEKEYFEVLDLELGKCKFIVASLPKNRLFEKIGHIKIGTKYPKVAKEYFKKRGMDVEIIKIEGSVELAPILNLCDGIVDIMETGTTLRDNGLIVLDEICDISARIIVNKASFKMKGEEIKELLSKIESIQKEEKKEIIEKIEYSSENKDKLSVLLKSRKDSDDKEKLTSVKNIISVVKELGDEGLYLYTKKFDTEYASKDSFKVTSKEIENAYKFVSNEFIENIKEAKKNIEEYHKLQNSNGYELKRENGAILGQRILPLEKVGVYVPGGTAAYPSTVLMNVIPAKVAGVKEIIMITPPDKKGNINPYIAVTADILGVEKIYKVGGAQGIAALAYGTESIKKVDKIVGPGNTFVALAKKEVFGDVDIDMIAGPSEILIIGDENSNPKYIAADLMSQAEHDILASSVLVTTSKDLARKVIDEINKQIVDLSRSSIIEEALRNYGKIIICETLEECFNVSNHIAPEHLEILLENPEIYLNKIKNAGSVFLGEYSPEPVGDYFGGTNHVLPTSGTAKFFSPLSVDSFIKKSSYLYYSKEALLEDGEKIINIANTEGLTAHGNSIKVRLDYERSKGV